MHIDELKAAVQPSLTEDFDAAFQRFADASGTADLMGFLLDLVERDLLKPEALQAINAALPQLEDGTLSRELSDDGANGEDPDDVGTLASQPSSSQPFGDDEQGADDRGGRSTGERSARSTGEREKRATGERQRRRTRRDSDDVTAPRKIRARTEDGAPSRSRRPTEKKQIQNAEGKVGRGYDFVGFVGEGAMGKVRLAKDLDLQRTVAYKEMSEEILRNRTLAAKFYAEAQITAQLDHPNIVPIYSLDQTDAGALAYSMKLIKGKTVEKLIEECWEFYDNRKRVDEGHSLATRLEMFLKVCEAMHYAHSRGVIHRDLKPENIMIGPYGEVYVMDWGIAKVMEPPSGKTPTAWVLLEDKQKAEGEIIIGTPQYMSPEQADGVTETLTAASDQYAMGLILYELVSLRQAVSGPTPMAIITRQTEGDKDPLRHYGSDKIPTELRAIIEKATALKIEHRYERVKELAEDIRRYMRGEAVKARPDTPLQKLLRWVANHREITLLSIVAGFLFFVIVTASSQAFYQYQRINAAAREQALTEVLTDVGTQAAIIDGNFVRYEGLLGVLAASTVEMLSRPDPGDTADVFLPADFEGGRVPGYTKSEFYGMSLSLEFPISALAPDANLATGMANLRRLAPLRRYHKSILLRSKSEQVATYTQARADRYIRETGVPIVWAHVGTTDGAYSGFPGHAGFPDIFDPRKTPWYELGGSNPTPQWGKPYIDPNGLGLILPCSKALFSDQEQQLGVVAVELTFDFIIEELLEIDAMEDHSEAFLLNSEGQIVVRSSKKGKEFRGSSLRARTIRLPEFDDEQVLEAIGERQSGYIETQRDNTRTLVMYQRMSTLGWYYVVMGPSADLLY